MFLRVICRSFWCGITIVHAISLRYIPREPYSFRRPGSPLKSNVMKFVCMSTIVNPIRRLSLGHGHLRPASFVPEFIALLLVPPAVSPQLLHRQRVGTSLVFWFLCTRLPMSPSLLSPVASLMVQAYRKHARTVK
ncbi:hypothetical protein BJV74DRAFT_284330 [Russula compacta]|nr:hypothetical protein BJV74DRAFT_284330 [Russula compacta]